MDEFTGRLYSYLPCHFCEKTDLKKFNEKLLKVKSKKQIDLFYEKEVKVRLEEEVSERSRKEFERGFLGEFLFEFFETDTGNIKSNKKLGRVYYTLNKITKLCVLNVVFCIEKEPVTQFLERMTCENLVITHNDESNFDFYLYLKSEWGLDVVGKSRACLSSGQAIHDDLKPSLFASESYQSGSMEYASLLSTFDRGSWTENIAIYNSSQIFASKTAVLRYDPKLDNTDIDKDIEGGLTSYQKALRRDLMLTFIVEILMFREASIKRANLRVNHSIQQDKQLSLLDINNLMGDFKSAILFWDLDIFLYSSAQQLADILNEKFDIDRSLETYRKNQNFLEQRVNISGAIQAEKETRTINYIAIIVFFFEAIRVLYSVSKSIVRKEEIPIDIIYSGGLAFAGSMVLFLSILLVVRMRRLRTKVS